MDDHKLDSRTKDALICALNTVFGSHSPAPVPAKILKSGKATIVFWEDGTKTVVRCAKDEIPDDYDAFTAALAKKVYGSNTHVKKMIKAVTAEQKKKGE